MSLKTLQYSKVPKIDLTLYLNCSLSGWHSGLVLFAWLGSCIAIIITKSCFRCWKISFWYFFGWARGSSPWDVWIRTQRASRDDRQARNKLSHPSIYNLHVLSHPSLYSLPPFPREKLGPRQQQFEVGYTKYEKTKNQVICLYLAKRKYVKNRQRQKLKKNLDRHSPVSQINTLQQTSRNLSNPSNSHYTLPLTIYFEAGSNGA